MTDKKDDLPGLAKKSGLIANTDGPAKGEWRPSIDDPVRDVVGNLVDVNNDRLEGDHRLDGDLLTHHRGLLLESDELDIRNKIEGEETG